MSVPPRDPEALRVYADELQQRGEVLGEFIALSLRAESNVFERHVQRRLAELTTLHEATWARGLPSSVRAEGTVLVQLRRGVPARLVVAGLPATQTIEAYAAAHPITELRAEFGGQTRLSPPASLWAQVDSVSLHSSRIVSEYAQVATPNLRRLTMDSVLDGTRPLELPTGCRLDTLEVKEGGLRRAAVEALLTDERVAGLTSLQLSLTSAGPWLVPALERWPLRTLGLVLGRQAAGEPLASLAQSRLRQTVSSLRLIEHADGSPSNLAGVEALLSVPWPALRQVALRLRVPIPASLMRDSVALEQVESLSFDLAALSPEAVEALAVRELPALRELHLGATRLTTAGLARLLTAPWVKQLEVLDLERNVLPSNAGGLLGAAQWPNLIDLKLGQSAVGAAGVDALLQGEFPELRHLRLDVSDGANAQLFMRYAELPWLQLTSLVGSSNEHLVAVAQAPHASRLRHLTMANAALDGPALRALVESSALQHLVQLTVPELRGEGLALLRERFGERLLVKPSQFHL